MKAFLVCTHPAAVSRMLSTADSSARDPHSSVMGAGPRLSPVPIKNHGIRGSKNRPVVHPLQMPGWVKRKAALLLLRDLSVKDLLCLGS